MTFYQDEGCHERLLVMTNSCSIQNREAWILRAITRDSVDYGTRGDRHGSRHHQLGDLPSEQELEVLFPTPLGANLSEFFS
jgi:hypothetical protein